MMLEGPQYEKGFEVVEDVALLKPGEAFVAIILPTSETARESVRVTLEYLEEPTRLEKSHVSRRILLPYRLCQHGVFWTSGKNALSGNI